MLLLTLFAFVAGAATAISPCVLPVLPALLAAGAAGGRRRPLGIVIGLAVTFTVTIVGLAEVVESVGVGDGAIRTLAIVVLAAVGLVLFVPALAARIEAPVSRLARFGPKSGGDGFWSGIGVGAALGFVYAPCAGPILAAVITVGAATGETIVIGTAYAIGSALTLLLLALAGRRLLAPLRRGNRMAGLQRAAGAVMALTAVAMAFQLDIRFQEAIADGLPAVVYNPTSGLERSDAVQDRLAELRGKPKFAEPASSAAAPGTRASDLPVLGTAPDFVGNQRWFNTPGDKALTLDGLRGKVVLIDFWTYTCINCIRTFPYLKAWYDRYRDAGLEIVGIHAPEFTFEKDAGNVEQAIESNDIRYPVVQDNDLATWQAWGNSAWPAKYLIDAQGRVRYVHIGEGEYEESEAAIRSLLAEAGEAELGATAEAEGVITPTDEVRTPEVYLGTDRSEGFTNYPKFGTNAFTATPADALELDQFTLGGIWTAGPQSLKAGIGAVLTARVQAQNVYLVLSPPKSGPGRVQVSFDGRPPRTFTVRKQRLYTLANFKEPGEHVLTLRLQSGVAGYAFTFG